MKAKLNISQHILPSVSQQFTQHPAFCLVKPSIAPPWWRQHPARQRTDPPTGRPEPGGNVRGKIMVKTWENWWCNKNGMITINNHSISLYLIQYIYIICGFAMDMLRTTVRSIYNGNLYCLWMFTGISWNIMIILIECNREIMEQGRPALTEIIIIPDSYLTQDSTFDILFNEIRLGRFTNCPGKKVRLRPWRTLASSSTRRPWLRRHQGQGRYAFFLPVSLDFQRLLLWVFYVCLWPPLSAGTEHLPYLKQWHALVYLLDKFVKVKLNKVQFKGSQ